MLIIKQSRNAPLPMPVVLSLLFFPDCVNFCVMITLKGTYKDGKVELAEHPVQIAQSRVLVTFLDSKDIDLRSAGIDEAQAADLRARLKPFAEDWDRPETAIYD